MALTDRRPVSLSTNTPVSSSPTFNPNTLGISSRKTKNRKNSLPLHPTEKQEVKEEENNEDTKEINSQDDIEDEEDEDMDQHLEQNSDDKHSLSLHDGDDFDHDRDLDTKDGDDKEEEDDDDDKHSIASDLGKMGLTNDSETLSTSRSTSPDSMLDKNKSHTRESTPPTTTSTPSSSQNDSAEKASSATATATATATAPATGTKKVKKAKPISRAPIATGISTAIPVTGEKPKPIQEGDASLEDDVLYAIFVILYERDPQGHGFTVKQICDVLTEEHPQIASLSTKTSNLVSAKLNAYVKRVEKGDTNLKYAISRDWADASPKRMVYVYRGLLAPGFEVVAKKLTDELKQQRSEEKAHAEHNNNSTKDDAAAADGDVDVNADLAETTKSVSTAASPKSGKKHHHAKDTLLPVYTDDSLEAGKQATLAKPRRQTMFDLGVTKNSFFETGSGSGFDKTNLFVPYASAPVTAALSKVSKRRSSDMMDLDIGANTYGDADAGADADADNDADEDDEDDDDDDDDVFANVFADSDDDDEIDSDYAMIETIRKNGKRSKSMSYLSMTKKTKVLTAAAAAPRASRAPSSHSPNAAAAAAALHAAALRAIARSSANTATTTTTKANGSSCSEESAAASASTVSASTCAPGSLCSNKKWLSVIRSGFLSQDIGAPEDTSLSDIEKFFA